MAPLCSSVDRVTVFHELVMQSHSTKLLAPGDWVSPRITRTPASDEY